MRAPIPLLAAVLLGAAGPAGAQPTYAAIWNVGSPASQYDIVVAYDGYTGPYTAPGSAFNDGLAFRTALLSYEPYLTYQNYLNIWGIYRPSLQSGADQPQNGVARDTAYNASYNQSGIPRCVLLTNTGAQPLGSGQGGLTLAQSDALGAPGYDGHLLAIVNDPLYGGCAQLGVHGAAYNGTSVPSGPLVGVHEHGHVGSFLGDEYGGTGGPGGPYPFSESALANIVNLTTIISPLKWASWIGTGGVVTPPPAGGAGYDTGIYHPTAQCMMNDGVSAHCVVCTERIVWTIYTFADSFVGTTPASGSTVTLVQGQQQGFSFTHRVPNGNEIVSWSVDGVAAAFGTTSFTFDSTTYAPGTYTVTAVLTDNTPLVRSDPFFVMTKTRSWTVVVQAPLPDLSVTGFTNLGLPVAAGDNVSVVGTLVNSGTGPATNVLVDYFLSATPGTPDPAVDYYLGQEVVASVPAGSSAQLFSGHQVPYHLPDGSTWTLGAIVDRLDNITELDETNNTASDPFPLAVTAPAGCPEALEFNAPLSFQGLNLTMSAAAGASIPIEITAPCRAGEWYLVALSVTGTGPFALSPTVSIPLTPDAVTTLGVQLANVPPLNAFLGLLDANGRATATYTPAPGTLAPGGFKVYLAAALFTTPPTVFTGATNASVLRVDP